MVVTFLPSASQANIVQAFTALPSRWTTQAPHWDVSHPTWVPVSRSPSRRYWTRSVRASASAVTALPFTVIETFGIRLLLERGAQSPSFLTPDPAGRGRSRDLDHTSPHPEGAIRRIACRRMATGVSAPRRSDALRAPRGEVL